MALVAFASIPSNAKGQSDPQDSSAGSKPDVLTLENSTQLMRGIEVYNRTCVGCHGPAGDGRGEAAAMLNPPPANFAEASFKFSSKRAGALPADEDLFRVIKTGLKGTAMPAFRFLPDSDVRAVIAFIKTFSDDWQDEPDPPIPFSANPWTMNPEGGVALGDRVYHLKARCAACHPSYHIQAEIDAMARDLNVESQPLRANAHLSIPGQADGGRLNVPPDFTRDWIKTGDDPRSLYRVIGAGIATTEMPAWVDALEPRELWGLAYYVRSLSDRRPYRIGPAGYELRPSPRELLPAGEGDPPSDETTGDE